MHDVPGRRILSPANAVLIVDSAPVIIEFSPFIRVPRNSGMNLDRATSGTSEGLG